MARDLDDRRKAFEQKKALLEKEAAQIAKAERKWEDRRKIIVGAAVLNAMSKDVQLFDRIQAILKSGVTRDSDKKHVADLIGEPAAKRESVRETASA